MMTIEQPNALRLAKMIEHYNAGVMSQKICEDYLKAAAELRRLHQREADLVAQLEKNNPLLDEAAAELDHLHEANQELLEALKLAREALLSCSAGDYSTDHVIHPSFDVDAVNKAIEAIDALAEQPAPVAAVNTSSERVDKTEENVHEKPAKQPICGLDVYLDPADELKPKLYSPQSSKPLPFNKEDMEGLDVNQRLGFKLGWKSAEEAHGIKGDA